jgi:hypothetical protein
MQTDRGQITMNTTSGQVRRKPDRRSGKGRRATDVPPPPWPVMLGMGGALFWSLQWARACWIRGRRLNPPRV